MRIKYVVQGFVNTDANNEGWQEKELTLEFSSEEETLDIFGCTEDVSVNVTDLIEILKHKGYSITNDKD